MLRLHLVAGAGEHVGERSRGLGRVPRTGAANIFVRTTRSGTEPLERAPAGHHVLELG